MGVNFNGNMAVCHRPFAISYLLFASDFCFLVLRGFAALLAVFAEFYLPFNLLFVFAGIVIAHSANGTFHSY